MSLLVKKRVTLTFDVDVLGPDDLDDKTLHENMEKVLLDWDEGRYPFSVEMLNRGLVDCFQKAVVNTVGDKIPKSYAEEFVPFETGGMVNRFYVERDKLAKQYTYYNGGSCCTEVKTVSKLEYPIKKGEPK